jgi:hypothetical protein
MRAKAKEVEYGLFMMAEDNPTGYITGGTMHTYMLELVALRDFYLARQR